ncbi:hypothetical protein MNB_SV-15-152 [hydrothermal vent metagenome]|uniref:Uncharacterized protein n=1 Tax=hydrothermal vent metagenome TaxID=652676 RepID=A0A1W1EL57_9ZZZZ
MEYQKELSNKEKYTYILECVKNINRVNSCQEIVSLLESLAKTLVTAKYAKLWVVEDNQLCRLQNDKIINIPKNRGIMAKAIDTGEIFYVNGVLRNKNYEADIDNFDKLDIKDIIYFPLKNIDGDIKFIIQAMTSVYTIQQFTKNDIESLKMMIEYVHHLELSNCCNEEIDKKEEIDKERHEDLIDKLLSFLK